jgi:xanthine dehydrogenase accessory factor
MLNDLIILVKGAGETASGVAHRLFRSQFKVCLTEIAHPQTVRRGVAFSEAVYEGEKEIEGITAQLISSPDLLFSNWEKGKIPLLIDPNAEVIKLLKPDVLVDARMAKKNLGSSKSEAPLVIGLGPSFEAGKDVHVVIETNRGQYLGKVILCGRAEPDSGIPDTIAGFSRERILYASQTGRFATVRHIGESVVEGELVGYIGQTPVKSQIKGIVRGLLRDGAEVRQGMKIGDIDPREVKEYCYTISDKDRAVAGGVLEAILYQLNTTDLQKYREIDNLIPIN